MNSSYIYDKVTDNSSYGEWQIHNVTNSSFQVEWQAFSPDVDITDIFVQCVLTPLVLLIGLAGNATTIIVFKSQLKRGPTVMFIISLAFCDLTFLFLCLVFIVYAWLQMFALEAIRYIRPNSLFWVALSNTFHRAGGGIIIVIIIERIIAVWFPFNIREISTRKRAKGIIVFVIITIFITSGPGNFAILSTILTESIPSTGAVSTQSQGTRFVQTRSTLIEHLQTVSKDLFDIIPIPLVIILNPLVIIGISRSVSSVSKQLRTLQTAM